MSWNGFSELRDFLFVAVNDSAWLSEKVEHGWMDGCALRFMGVNPLMVGEF